MKVKLEIEPFNALILLAVFKKLNIKTKLSHIPGITEAVEEFEKEVMDKVSNEQITSAVDTGLELGYDKLKGI